MSGRGWQDRLKLPLRPPRKPEVSSGGAPQHSKRPPPPPPPRPPPLPPVTPLVSFKLLSPASLEVEVCYSAYDVQHRTFDLNQRLGNDDGGFELGGKNFSHSARNVRLRDRALCAELKAMNKDPWYLDKVGLDVELPYIGPGSYGIELKIVHFQAHHSKLAADDTARLTDNAPGEHYVNLRLISGFLLAAECLQPDGRYATSYVKLDDYLSNSNGSLNRRGHGFSDTVRNTVLMNTTLSAELDGRGHRSSIDISLLVRCAAGRLVPFRINDPWNAPAPFFDEDDSDEDALPGTRRLRLVATSILVADCLNDAASYVESAFKLDSIIGIADKRVRLFARDFSVSGDRAAGTDVELRGTQLTFSIKQSDEQFDFKKTTLDLNDILTLSNGNFVLREYGIDCTACQDVFRAGVVYSEWDKTHRTKLYPRNKLSRNSDCGLCELIDNVVSHVTDAAGGCQIFSEAYTDGFQRTMKLFELDVKWRGRERRYQVFLDAEVSPLPAALEYMPQLKATENWLEPDYRPALVHSWIEQCFKNHKRCQVTGRPRLPTRVLDIGTNPEDDVRVLTPARELGRYACLSHCWGGHRPCTLTSKTFARYSKCIPAADMPQMYKEAILACRQLGLRYLWIDSLCILQDSREDWLTESPKMVDYYGQCHICIAATSVAGSNSSLKIAERPSAIRAEGVDSKGVPYGLLAYPSDSLPSLPHFSRADLPTLQKSYPLMTRAWALQERWLAPRTLHFCAAELVFECIEGLHCECGHAGDDYILPIQDERRVMPIDNMRDGIVLKRRVEALEWTNFISAYSSLNLSFASDRLPAVSGLARDFSTQRQAEGLGRYLAGMWEKTLHHELVWFVGTPLLTHEGGPKKERLIVEPDPEPIKQVLARKPRCDEYVGPTYSWASVFEGVTYRSRLDNRKMFDVVDAHVQLSGADPYGSVSKGCFLKLRGKLLETGWAVRGDRRQPVAYRLLDVIGTQQLSYEKSTQGILFLPDYTISVESRHAISEQDSLFMFPVLTQGIFLTAFVFSSEEERKAMDEWRDFVGRLRNTLCLVLRKLEYESDEGLPIFERIGFTEYASVGTKGDHRDNNSYTGTTFMLV